ncbi:putative aTP-phosphoribosyltransferase [Pseudomonas aeruginosa]|nr:Hypothetical protein SCV20265_5075 [Pseudomonas aeruginosa SCV20265]AJD60112.1 ATP phosphoribosyltransferase [Pseudomonas aeruginosa]ARI04140.1 hypothetical protein Y880_04348 [Pseudomonas aeruginosa PAK]EWH25865.1 ATP phosphoribosyltransferase [Pseudomonas aeruginosa SG17M]CCQ86931.1 hypothetical protein PA18A_3542 [Pseudomonas aeruginosa 18A]BAK88025.1 ATP-phosphoribosyltransferase [Pseudomonas aeruginosa NCGM2.S1]GAA21115.1 ATP-phosphoribosyltransferase [Pseudomonas aeruginosa NCMG1179]
MALSRAPLDYQAHRAGTRENLAMTRIGRCGAEPHGYQ